MTERLTLTVKTEPDELLTISTAVEEFAERENWPQDLVFRVNLVLEELSLNIMNHGHDGGEHDIDIVLASEEDSVTIEITDDGRPFDPRKDAPPPDLDSPISERRIGGLGVHFALSIMDDLSYRREQGKNHLTLKTRRA